MDRTQAEGTAELAPGLHGPARLELRRAVGEPAVDVAVDVEWDGSAYRVRRVEAEGADVTREALERLPVRALVARAVLDSMSETVGDTLSPAQSAASVYRVGLAVGEAPLLLVAERLGVSRATAARRVADARAQGLLGDHEVAPQGGAAARRSTRLT